MFDVLSGMTAWGAVSEGQLYTWGKNLYGNLGVAVDDLVSRWTPTLTMLSSQNRPVVDAVLHGQDNFLCVNALLGLPTSKVPGPSFQAHGPAPGGVAAWNSNDPSLNPCLANGGSGACAGSYQCFNHAPAAMECFDPNTGLYDY